ncbi:hypothetical protein ONS95_005487 [Cadophora gregata]|uniref:uncharacterized protein n=1 Tax=Cadophora gregata TaxID=51156 RepID=UPI0026DA6E4E|nr:uncharacterized protein ONS95_005487 [Cadophora gregata]KAK0103464.1 hypothetical protein ONS95_005487 [Cadophora gregata]KAK0107654.1 hypothetical protein ONS96_003457 [Cadophora gregata f. sp. sojae]
MDHTNPTTEPANEPARVPSSHKPIPREVERRPEDIQDEATFRAASIFRSRDRLQYILDSYQDMLLRRWSKKTRGAREDILVEAWPDIPLTHRPDFALFHRFEPLQFLITDPHELIAAKFPSLNVEDLSYGKHFLMLVDARARNAPKLFARSDLEASVISRARGAFSLSICPGHSMSLDGDTPSSYGKVISLVGNDQAQDRLKYGIDYTISEGLLVLEIQQKVLQFLESCCESVLHDKPLPNPNEGWTSLNEMNRNAPYHSPRSPDFHRLMSLFAANLTMNADHLWELRIDPSYFLESVKACHSSRREAVNDSLGQAHPATETQDYWETCAGSAAENAYCSVIMAEIDFGLAAKLHSIYASLPINRQISVDELKSAQNVEFLEGMLYLRNNLVNQFEDALTVLSYSLPTERTFREYFVRDTNASEFNARCIYPRGKDSDELFPYFSALLFLEPRLEVQMGPKNLLAEIERVVESNPEQKMRLSPNVLQLIGRVGYFMHAIESIDKIQPSVRVAHTDLMTNGGPSYASFVEESSKLVIRHTQFLEEVKGMSYEGFGPPDSGRFEYPCWKPRKRQNIDQMRQAESWLDKYWEMFDHGFHSSSGKSIHEYDPRVFKCRQIIRTPVEEPRIKPKPKDSGVVLDDIDLALAQLKQDESSKDCNEAVKTSSPEPNLEANNVLPIQDFLATDRTHFTFTERSLKVFRKMFKDPYPEPPADIKWSDFLTAMIDAGFQICKQYGSLWHFTPICLGMDRSIFLYEPRIAFDARSGVLEMDFKHAQRLARRLNYAYGWDETWFAKK